MTKAILYPIVLSVTFLGFDCRAQSQVPKPLDNCHGTPKPLTVVGGMPYIAAQVNGSSGMFIVDYGSNTDAIDVNQFDPTNQPYPYKQDPSFKDEYVFTKLEWVWAVANDVSFHMLAMNNIQGIRQAGRLGTDILKENVVTLDYQAHQVFERPPADFCKPETLLEEGFAAASTSGQFVHDTSVLPADVKNIPRVPVRIGGVDGVGEIDTGLDPNQFPNSVIVNEIYLAALQKAGVGLRRLLIPVLPFTSCGEVKESLTAYAVEPNIGFDVVGKTKDSVLHEAGLTLLVKHPTDEFKSCGGIGFLPVAAAQFGASSLIRAKQIIFDAYTSTVWFRQ